MCDFCVIIIYKKGGNALNKRISEIRKNNKLTQDEFAERIGLTKNFISLVETGNREPSDRTIKDICREFSVSERWLRTGEGQMMIKLDRNQEIASFTNDVMADMDESFRKRLFSALSKLNEKDWEVLEKIADELTESRD